MLALQNQGTIYVVVDAVNECPKSFQNRTGRERVLEIAKELIQLGLPHFRLCVTSRPEVDIVEALPVESSKLQFVSLDNQDDHLKGVTEYVESVVNSDSKMKNWPEETKRLVIDTVPKTVGGVYVKMVIMLRITFSRTSGFDAHPFNWKRSARSHLPIFQELSSKCRRSISTRHTNEYY